MKVYCFSGLGSDERVFEFLKLDSFFEIVTIPWIKPLSKESIEDYSARISSTISSTESFFILGVSFGGIVAQEVAKHKNATAIIAISSIKERSQIPLGLKLTPNFIFSLPSFLFKLSPIIANYVFGARNKLLLKQILKDTQGSFVKWALFALKNWQSKEVVDSFYISGGADRLLKPFQGAEILDGGGHFMIVDKAEELNELINIHFFNSLKK